MFSRRPSICHFEMIAQKKQWKCFQYDGILFIWCRSKVWDTKNIHNLEFKLTFR